MDNLFDMKHEFTFNPFGAFDEDVEVSSPVKPHRKRAKTSQRRATSLPTKKGSAGYNIGELLLPAKPKASSTTRGKRKYSAGNKKAKQPIPPIVGNGNGNGTSPFDLEGDMSMLKIPNSPRASTGRKKTPHGKGGAQRRSSSNPEKLRKRAGSTTGKLRGNYNCGKCGVPKKGHVCPHDQPKQMNDAETQCAFDGTVLTGESISHSRTACDTTKYRHTTPKDKRANDIMEILNNMQAMGIIQLKDPTRAMSLLLNGVGNAAAAAIATAVPAEFAPAAAVVASTTKVLLPSPKHAQRLRTFDTDESNVAGDPYDIDMDLSDAFEVTPDLHDLLSETIDSQDAKVWDPPMDIQDSAYTPSAISSA